MSVIKPAGRMTGSGEIASRPVKGRPIRATQYVAVKVARPADLMVKVNGFMPHRRGSSGHCQPTQPPFAVAFLRSQGRSTPLICPVRQSCAPCTYFPRLIHPQSGYCSLRVRSFLDQLRSEWVANRGSLHHRAAEARPFGVDLRLAHRQVQSAR